MTESRGRGFRVSARFVAAALLLSCVVCARLSSGGESAGKYRGRLLVAQPQVRDPRFAKSVVYVVAHDSTGTMGLVINKVTLDATCPISNQTDFKKCAVKVYRA